MTTIEGLKSFFDVATVVLLFLTFLAGAGVLMTGNIINARQAQQLRQFDQSLTAAKTELGKQQERAAKAEADIATANQKAAEAQATAEGFRRNIAQANQQAAEANRVAEEERLARVRIEEKLAGWGLTAAAQARIIEGLKQYHGTHFDLGADPGELAFMETMDGLLGSAGWIRQQPRPDNPLFSVLLDGKARINYVSGVYVEIAQSSAPTLDPAAEALVSLLRSEGIPAQGQIATQESDATCIHLVIGKK